MSCLQNNITPIILRNIPFTNNSEAHIDLYFIHITIVGSFTPAGNESFEIKLKLVFMGNKVAK
jgi:hypothetical protein